MKKRYYWNLEKWILMKFKIKRTSWVKLNKNIKRKSHSLEIDVKAVEIQAIDPVDIKN